MLLNYARSFIEILISNISDVLAILGISATLVQSYKAKSAAIAAKDAAEDTRRQIKSVEISFILQECLHDAENLLHRVDNENWESASDTSFRIRKNLITAKTSLENNANTTNLASNLEEIILQFKIANDATDRAKHGRGRPLNKITLSKTVREQIDVLLAVQQNIITSIGSSNGTA